MKLRCKKLPQDLEWKPRTGIQLINNDVDFVPVRVEDLKLYEIFKSLNRYLGTMGNDEKLKVSMSSDAVGDDDRKKLKYSLSLQNTGLTKSKRSIQTMTSAIISSSNISLAFTTQLSPRYIKVI